MGLVPGVPFAIARITNEAAQTPPKAELKGGELARLAGIFCNDEHFKLWCILTHGKDALETIYELCGIQSRVELDHNDKAAEKFHDEIRIPFLSWKESK